MAGTALRLAASLHRLTGGGEVSVCIPSDSTATVVDAWAGFDTTLMFAPVIAAADVPDVAGGSAALWNGLNEYGSWPLDDLGEFEAGFSLHFVIAGADYSNGSTIAGASDGTRAVRIQHADTSADDLTAAITDGTNTLSARSATGDLGIYGASLRVLLVTFDLPNQRILAWLDGSAVAMTLTSAQSVSPPNLAVPIGVAAYNNSGSPTDYFDGSHALWARTRPVLTDAIALRVNRAIRSNTRIPPAARMGVAL